MQRRNGNTHARGARLARLRLLEAERARLRSLIERHPRQGELPDEVHIFLSRYVALGEELRVLRTVGRRLR